MRKKVLFGTAAIMTLCLASCQQYDITQNFSENTKYADEFIEEFGQPDPLQDWSMATRATIYVDLTGNEDAIGGHIKVYSSDPYSSDARILYSKDVPDNLQLTQEIDVPKNLSCVYVLMINNIGYCTYKPALIQDGRIEVSFAVEISDETRARGNFDTHATNDIKYWEGKVPDGQYEQVVPTDAITVEGTVHYIDNNTYPGKQYIHLHNADINNMNFWMGVNIYVTGHVTVERWYTGTNTNVYVLEGAELTLPDYASFEQNNTTLTICDDAEVHAKDYFKVGQGNIVYNNGEIYTGGFEICNDGIVYNEGKIEVDNTIGLKNGASTLVNSGTIRGTDFSVEGSSNLYNSGVISLKGTTIVNSNSSTWYNRGHYTTKDFVFASTSPNWLNECHLKITNHLQIVLGGSPSLPVNNSYIETGTMYMNNAGMKLGPNSQLIVNNTALFGYNVYNQWNTSCGLQSTATGNDWAVFKATKVEQESYNQGFTISYVGNLIIDCCDHFAQGYSDKSPEQQAAGEIGYQPYINIVGNAKMAPGGDNYSIPGGDCSEPYNARIIDAPDSKPQSWIMACEDLGGTNDYDFNDVVFSVSHIPGENTATITPLAAGGTLASILCYKDAPIKGNALDSEIHYLLGSYDTTVSGKFFMLNTARGNSTEYVGSPVTIRLDNPKATIDEIAKLITVHVIARNGDVSTGDYKVSQIVSRPEQGEMPQIILVPDNWIWPVERIGIKQAYPSFENWVKDASLHDWSSVAVKEYIVRPYDK